MKKGRFLVQWAGIVTVLALLSIYAGQASGMMQAEGSGDEGRADIIMIDSLEAFGKLEEAPVVFLHDKHTDALAKLGKKECTTCHETDKDRLQPKFKRLKDADKGTVKEIYHQNCIACHKEIAAQGAQSGPTEAACRDCHAEKPEAASAWTPIGMDKSLHFRHLDSKVIVRDKDDRTCGSCHHEYDPQTKKLFYAKGKEGSCSYCHLEERKDDVKSMRTAAHLACVNCHAALAAEKVETGPLQCAGCHSEQSQAKFKVVKDVPRLKREQPDAALITVADERALSQDKKGLMNPVAFNHKAHEQFNDNCKTCHHKAIESCAKECHTLSGNEKGGFVPLEKAMHSVTSKASCVGCHNQRKVDKDCAGCHSLMPRERVSQATCATCHDKSLEIADTETLRSLSKEAKAGLADAAVAARRPAGMYDLAQIPEEVVVSDLVDKYEPARFPHRKIVETLAKKADASEMAKIFHRDKGTLCQGCHHNSPAAQKPPRCASCHGKPFAADDARPGLKAAFHQQCIGCHKAMELEKPAATACADCHKERKK